MSMNVVVERAKIGDVEISVETGKLAKQTTAVMISCGGTSVLLSAASSKEAKDLPFLPLTVEYREPASGAGKIPGGYFKREGRPTYSEIISARCIDRPIRPLFPKGYRFDTQIISNAVSNDRENEPDVLAITAASTALTLSSIPWAGPIAGIRVGRLKGRFIAFPTFTQQQDCDIVLVVAVSRDAIVMVEGGAKEASEEAMIDALMFAKEAAQPLLDMQDRLRAQVGQEKLEFIPPSTDAELEAAVFEHAKDAFVEALAILPKHERHDALRAAGRATRAALAETYPGREEELKAAVGLVEKKLVRTKVIEQGIRIDGRKPSDIRPIYIEAGPLERPHGSALFQRGETQALVTTTLGTESDVQRLDTIRGDVYVRFMLHYNFPPFCTGEVKPLRGQSRREIGHGMLAQRALSQVMPSAEDFPYMVRIVSDTLESNGSSSMAAVCGGCLSLMDAGVPISAPVAGIAMGLMQEGDKIAVLSDILGDEDHLGDMDFKVTGTEKGITALQMDIKISGLTRDILKTALDQAREGRLHILGKMNEVLAAPREDISQYAPRIVTIKVSVDKIRDIIGPGGKTIRAIQEQTGVNVNVDDSGRVTIASENPSSIMMAQRMIEGLTAEAEVGAYYHGVVKRVVDFGAFVEVLPGTDGLVHISELEEGRVENVRDVLTEGDEVVVKVLNVDQSGKIRLSRRAAFGVDPSEVMNMRG